MKRESKLKAVGLAIVGFSFGACATPQGDYVETTRPGGKSEINLPLHNDPRGVADMTGIRISYRVEPRERASDVILNEKDSILGPLDIRRGEEATLSLKFSISPSAPEGSFNIVLVATMTSFGALSSLATYDEAGNLVYPPVKIVVKKRRFPWF